jgi:hypothetical protein
MGQSQTALHEEMSYRRDFNVLAAQAREVAGKLGVQLVLPELVGERNKKSAGKAKGREKNPYCVLPWLQGVIKPTGEYRVCDGLPKVGNLDGETFAAIYSGQSLKRIRQRLFRCSADACSWDCTEEAFIDPGDE